MLVIGKTREEKLDAVEINGVGGRRLGEKETVRREEGWDRGGVGERSELGECEAEGYGVEAESGDVLGERKRHVEVKKHGVGGAEEGKRLGGE